MRLVAVTKRAAGEASNAIAPAMSSGVPCRWAGILAANAASASSCAA